MKLIVEMEMPRGCYFCPMAEPHPTYWFCRAFDDLTQIDGCAPMDKRRSWCPIVGVLPDEHGRIIDEAVFCENVVKYSHQSTKTIGKALDATPTIIDMTPIVVAERKHDENN